ncbi:carbamoyl-phosphate synthase large subunit [Intestinicryptomonas porci]|uniref:Carbamoyl phosphate synthase large chain n=1 Tax=Intestinicryptomonas porci TaxID=2926320 RepID=A0ABU4WGV5_9BACT|nr:carbamoyl-phosphate synthase large subunit [Opitutales bacterium CLA-KB-P66]
MAKRTDIKSILIVGSGPIVIGQACEFDYSGSQACKALREEGYKVILVNSNPATIMTDPQMADVTYIEPLTPESLEKIIAKERPDALLPTLGGQTGLNLSTELYRMGILEKYGVEMIGAKAEAIEKGEDREKFREAMIKIGLDVPKSAVVHTMEEAVSWIEEHKRYPVIIRPSFTLGGTGSGIAYNRDEFERMVAFGLEASPVTEILIEESLIGWKEIEIEVMRDKKDQCIVICSIENFDPMGVHTGDSITIAPALTLTNKEYQLMRDASFAIIREIGVESGGSNIQFAADPKTGRIVIIEMNPRVSRSSALASKATGFPIAKMAAKLAVGYTLDELKNDIVKTIPASFEPTVDYIVAKYPRFAFEKFVGADDTLTSSMKSVGEVMSIGRTFKEAIQKAIRSLEIGARGLGGGGKFGGFEVSDISEITKNLVRPTANRMFYIRYALLAGMAEEQICELTNIDPWFIRQISEIVETEKNLRKSGLLNMTKELLQEAKSSGFTDLQIADICSTKIRNIKKLREEWGINTVYRLVDTCAGEFSAVNPYYYSTYGAESEIKHSDKKKIMIIGGGPNRIGQGIEFDYCCVHASFALREAGYETIIVNSNPETVSTDYDTSDKLFFEPLTLEDVLEVYKQTNCDGAIVQLGGQTPLNLASELKANGVNIIGTSPESIDAAEDREIFKEILDKLHLKQPVNATAMNPEQAYELAGKIGFPILLRPSFVLGGRGMFIVYNMDDMKKVIREAFEAAPGKPVLLDKFLEDAIELDVDAISDGETTVVGGMLEHIEYAGVHSGDAAMVLPPHTLSEKMLEEVRQATYALAKELKVVGLMNIQFAIKDNELYLLEVNPRASRTVPFCSKVIGVPLAKIGARVMAGEKLKDLGFTKEVKVPFVAVKESVFPFVRFRGATIMLSPEMRSTGEVMGLGPDLLTAFAKSQDAAQPSLPKSGNAFLSVKDHDKPMALEIAKRLVALGFKLFSTSGTAKLLSENGIPVTRTYKLNEGARPNVIDMIKNDEMDLIINTPSGMTPRLDENKIRQEALLKKVCTMTTMMAANVAVKGIEAMREKEMSVQSLQDYMKMVNGSKE